MSTTVSPVTKVFDHRPARAQNRNALVADKSDYADYNPHRELNYGQYGSPRRRPRTEQEVQQELHRIRWTNEGMPNSEAVIDAITQATDFTLPVEDKYLQRLNTYKRQVLPYRYPTCPVGWERHVSLPDKAEKMGVAWMDAEGYFCGPPGSDPSTKYAQPYQNRELVEQIKELKEEMKELLPQTGPALSEEDRRKKEQEKAKQEENRKKAQDARKASVEAAFTQEKDANIRTLTNIYKMVYTNRATAKDLASGFYAVAYKCVLKATGGEYPKFYKVDDYDDRVEDSMIIKRSHSQSTAANPKFVYLPKLLEDEEDPLIKKLSAWFVRFYNQKIDQHKQKTDIYINRFKVL